jgi:type II secretory pathway component GspD/PulD (secretin)
VITTAGKLVGSPTSGLAEDVPGLKFGFVANTVTGFIRALQTVGKTEILACPRLLVVNKQRAELQLGDRLGYMSTTQTQTSTTQTVQFMDIGTQLRLRPFVTCDGIVRMEIHPEKSSGQLNNAGIPQTSTAQVTTNVMVPDGATIVIGGLIETEKDSTETGIPVLSRLPVVGFLFRHTLATTTRKELIVILTPHIWKPCAPACLNSVVPPACPAEARARAGVVPSPKP